MTTKKEMFKNEVEKAKVNFRSLSTKDGRSMVTKISVLENFETKKCFGYMIIGNIKTKEGNEYVQIDKCSVVYLKRSAPDVVKESLWLTKAQYNMIVESQSESGVKA